MMKPLVKMIIGVLLAGFLQGKAEEHSMTAVNCCEHSKLNTGDASPLVQGPFNSSTMPVTAIPPGNGMLPGVVLIVAGQTHGKSGRF